MIQPESRIPSMPAAPSADYGSSWHDVPYLEPAGVGRTHGIVFRKYFGNSVRVSTTEWGRPSTFPSVAHGTGRDEATKYGVVLSRRRSYQATVRLRPPPWYSASHTKYSSPKSSDFRGTDGQLGASSGQGDTAGTRTRTVLRILT